MVSLPAIVAVITVLFWTTSGILSKRISTGLGAVLAATFVVVVGIAPTIVALLITNNFSVNTQSLVLASAAGIFLGLGFVLVYKSLETEQLTNSVALAEIQPAALVLFGLLVLGENITAIQMLCIIAIFAGSFFIISTKEMRINRKLIPAFFSPISWTVYWILMTYSIRAAGAFPMSIAVSRLAGAIFMLLFFLTYGKSGQTRLKAQSGSKKALYLVLFLAIIAAFADGTGDTLFSFVVGVNAVAIGGALGALAPMAVSVFGFVYYKDRLTKLQTFGLGIMVLGALTLALV